MRVKICGITREADALAAVEHGTDFVGLILAESPRRVSVTHAQRLANAIRADAEPVLVFRNAPLEDVLAAARAVGNRWIQLHGRESVAYLRSIKDALPELHVIRAWSIAAAADQPTLERYLHEAAQAGVMPDVLLLDAPKGGAHPGYTCLAEISRSVHPRPSQVWCAGGLTADNIATAVADGRYDGVDVAGGVEVSAGVKDHETIERFIARARAV